MDNSRRGFFQFLARGAGLLVVSGVAMRTLAGRLFREALPSRSIAPTNRKWVMVADLAKCDGCKDCTKACTKMHFVPPL